MHVFGRGALMPRIRHVYAPTLGALLARSAASYRHADAAADADEHGLARAYRRAGERLLDAARLADRMPAVPTGEDGDVMHVLPRLGACERAAIDHLRQCVADGTLASVPQCYAVRKGSRYAELLDAPGTHPHPLQSDDGPRLPRVVIVDTWHSMRDRGAGGIVVSVDPETMTVEHVAEWMRTCDGQGTGIGPTGYYACPGCPACEEVIA